MPFEIDIHADLSLAELIKIHNAGGVVLKTPHVGNIYPNNLAIATLGIPMLFYDRTIGRKDHAFRPHQIIWDGGSELIADANKLTTHAVVITPSKVWGVAAEAGTPIVKVHMSAFRTALPRANCFTYTDYIQRNAPMVTRILQTVTKHYPSVWTRVVAPDGTPFKASASNWGDIAARGVFGLNDMRRGWLIPTVISILLHGTVDIARARTNDVYLLSGPHMFRYVPQYGSVLNGLYDFVRADLGAVLPDLVHCHIIPVFDMRFVIENQHRNYLDRLVNQYLEFFRLDSSFRETNAAPDLDVHITSKVVIKRDIQATISAVFASFGATMFYDTRWNSFTQYDLINSDGLYIPEWAINATLDKVSRAFTFLRKCFTFVRSERKNFPSRKL